MKFPRLTDVLPSWKNTGLAVLSAVLLILAFPDFEFWFLAWFGLVPLFVAIDSEKESVARAFVLGWIWGFVFFTGTCWWLTFAPITYAGFPSPLAYFLLLGVTGFVGIFPGLFAIIASVLLRRYAGVVILAAPFVWVCTEFLRYWITGNNWNAVGYSQAFHPIVMPLPGIGGVLLVSFFVLLVNAALIFGYRLDVHRQSLFSRAVITVSPAIVVSLLLVVASFEYWFPRTKPSLIENELPQVVAVQPDVPMSGLTEDKWKGLRERHVQLAERSLRLLDDRLRFAAKHRDSSVADPDRPSITVIFPESPMNFMYEEDEEFRNFVHAFAAKHDVQVLFNSAEPDAEHNKYFNSAVLVGPDGKEIAQYDKIYLLPFGESVPAPLQSIVPAFVGSFSYGKEYDLLPLGDAKAGVMICFESHFGELGREYVRNGADVLIEMTNDGYLGPTPVLRQHLANAVFRAVETNRPVLRVTNVGITAYVNERGEVLDATRGYTEDTRVWSVSKSDGSQTFYVKYGDWFAWICSLVTIVLLGLSLRRRNIESS